MTDFIRMTALLAVLRKDFSCFGFELQRTWNGTAIAAVRERGAGPLYTLVTDNSDEMRVELATAATAAPAPGAPCRADVQGLGDDAGPRVRRP